MYHESGLRLYLRVSGRGHVPANVSITSKQIRRAPAPKCRSWNSERKIEIVNNAPNDGQVTLKTFVLFRVFAPQRVSSSRRTGKNNWLERSVFRQWRVFSVNKQ